MDSNKLDISVMVPGKRTVLLLLLGCWFVIPAHPQDDSTASKPTEQIKVIVAAPDKSSVGVIAVPPDTSWKPAAIPTKALASNAIDAWLHSESARNGLQSTDLRPWHIVISYDQVDEDGDNVHSGTVEELWAGPKKYKISYKSDNLNQTDYATEQGLFRLGDQRWPSRAEMQVRKEIVDPFSYVWTLQGFTANEVDRTFGSYTLHCVVLNKTGVISVPRQYCFDNDGTVLRYVRGEGWDQTVYNDTVIFEGRSIAREVEVTDGGRPYLKLHLKAIEIIPQLDDKDFVPPAEAVSFADKRITGVNLQPIQISNPEWPASLLEQHFSVTLQVVVGKNGHVLSAQAVTGPPDAHKAAEAAVRKWVFPPYLVVGEPVEAETRVTIQNQ